MGFNLPDKHDEAASKAMTEETPQQEIIAPEDQTKAGGKRKGAGRPKGTILEKTKLRLQRTEQAINSMEISPLEVMLRTMKAAYEEGNITLACQLARDAAPYVHPKLQPVDAKGSSAQDVNLNLTVTFA